MKKAGLHPSLAAGTSPTSGGIASIPEDAGQGFAQAGQAIDARMAQKKQIELIDAQIENIKAQTAEMQTDTGIKGQALAGSAIQTDQHQPSQVIERPPQEVRPVAQATDRSAVQYGSPGKMEVGSGLMWSLSNGVSQERIEQEYGEIVGNIYGIVKSFKDAGYNINLKRQYGVQIHEAERLYREQGKMAAFRYLFSYSKPKKPRSGGGGW